MKRHRPFLLLVAILGAFTVGLVWLFQLRLSGGDIFPAYSTLRADPLGTRAFYEGLRELPGLNVERMIKPMERLPSSKAQTVFLTGVNRWRWEGFDADSAKALEAALRAGSRVVVVFCAELEQVDDESRFDAHRKKSADEKKKSDDKKSSKDEKAEKKDDADKNKDQEKKSGEEEDDLIEKVEPANWEKRWGVEIKSRMIMDRNQGAVRASSAVDALPQQMPWKSDLYFQTEEQAGWQTYYTRGMHPVLIERKFGRGSIVMASDAYFLSNEAMLNHRETALLAWLVGANTHVVFVESVLGVEEDNGVAALARRYGLAGALAMFILLAALYVWRRMALFVPPPDEQREVALGYHPVAGLEALLRRVISLDNLKQACIDEWSRTARPADIERVRRTTLTLQTNAPALTAYNAIVRALRRR